MIDFIIIIGIALVAFIIILAMVFNVLGWGKCEHQFEKIYDGEGKEPYSHVIVCMCSKCGKRKITKV